MPVICGIRVAAGLSNRLYWWCWYWFSLTRLVDCTCNASLGSLISTRGAERRAREVIVLALQTDLSREMLNGAFTAH